jgi:hypothetical protein
VVFFESDHLFKVREGIWESHRNLPGTAVACSLMIFQMR